jgi:hypothetical protein
VQAFTWRSLLCVVLLCGSCSPRDTSNDRVSVSVRARSRIKVRGRVRSTVTLTVSQRWFGTTVC